MRRTRLISYRVTYRIPWVYTSGELDKWRVSTIRAHSLEDAKQRIHRRCPRADLSTMEVELDREPYEEWASYAD